MKISPINIRASILYVAIFLGSTFLSVGACEAHYSSSYQSRRNMEIIGKIIMAGGMIVPAGLAAANLATIRKVHPKPLYYIISSAGLGTTFGLALASTLIGLNARDGKMPLGHVYWPMGAAIGATSVVVHSIKIHRVRQSNRVEVGVSPAVSLRDERASYGANVVLNF